MCVAIYCRSLEKLTSTLRLIIYTWKTHKRTFFGWHCCKTCSRSWGARCRLDRGRHVPPTEHTLHLCHRSTVYNTWNPRASAVHIFPTQRVDETQRGQGMLMGHQRLGVSRMAAADFGHRDDMGHYNGDHHKSTYLLPSARFLTQAGK